MQDPRRGVQPLKLPTGTPRHRSTPSHRDHKIVQQVEGAVRGKVAALIACVGISACAPTIWDKPGGSQAEFNQDSARCRLFARGMNSGDFYAEGSPGFVASAAVGNAIGTAVNQQATYHDCMMAVGYSPRSPASSESPNSSLYGAFAYDSSNGKSGFSSKEPTQARAETVALQACAIQTCKVVFGVGPQMCGAIAISNNGRVWGGATRAQSNAAELAALENCQKRGGNQCKVQGAECNQ